MPRQHSLTDVRAVNTEDEERVSRQKRDTDTFQRDVLRELEMIAHVFDDRFRIPGTSIRFGLDSILGLLPGVGDTVTAGVSAYLVGKAHAAGARKRAITKTIANVGVDWVVGSIPLVGDIFDIAYKANRKNLELLREELKRQ